MILRAVLIYNFPFHFPDYKLFKGLLFTQCHENPSLQGHNGQ